MPEGSPGGISFTSTSGTMSFDGGTLSVGYINGIGIENGPGATVNIKSGTVKAYCGIVNKGTLNMYGGTIEPYSYVSRFAIDANYNGTVTNILGGKITGYINEGYNESRIYPNSSINIINNVEVNGIVYGANITVSGATIKRTVIDKNVAINSSTINAISLPDYGTLSVNNSIVGRSDFNNGYGYGIYASKYGVVTISGCTIYGSDGISA